MVPRTSALLDGSGRLTVHIYRKRNSWRRNSGRLGCSHGASCTYVKPGECSLASTNRTGSRNDRPLVLMPTPAAAYSKHADKTESTEK